MIRIDPAAFVGADAEVMAQVREVRDATREKVRTFVEELRARPA
jgi:hypothetical protein